MRSSVSGNLSFPPTFSNLQLHGNFGNSPVVVLVSDVGADGLCNVWPVTTFISHLLCGGCAVLRFNMRDSGRSTSYDGTAPPALGRLSFLVRCVTETNPPYSARTLADDIAELLLRLCVPVCHIVGYGYGGVIARLFAIHHPQTCISLTTIGTPNTLFFPKHKKKFTKVAKLHKSRPDVSVSVLLKARHLAEASRVMCTPSAKYDTGTLTEMWYQRLSNVPGSSSCPAAVLLERECRQLWCVHEEDVNAENAGRLAVLRACQKPMLIVHGSADPCVPVGDAIDFASPCAAADLVIMQGVAHDLPDSHTRHVAEAVLRLLRRHNAAQGYAAPPSAPQWGLQCSFVACANDSLGINIKSRLPQGCKK